MKYLCDTISIAHVVGGREAMGGEEDSSNSVWLSVGIRAMSFVGSRAAKSSKVSVSFSHITPRA